MKAVISGASRGLGRAIAKELASLGYDLILLSRSLEDLETLSEELSDQSSVQIHSIDLSIEGELKKIDLNINEEDKLILVNNVGIYSNEDITKLKRDDVQRLLETNLYASIDLTNALLPSLKKASSSYIINISSINGLEADAMAPAYSISKHGMKAWNDALREELRKAGIKVSAIYPGPINTTSWEGLDVPHEKMIQAEDISKMIAQIISLSDGVLIEEVRMNPLDFTP